MLTFAAIAVTLAALAAVPSSASGCTLPDITAGICPRASNEGSYIQVDASQVAPGSDGWDGDGGGGGGGDNGGGGGGGGGYTGPRRISPVPISNTDNCTPLTTTQFCSGSITADPADPAVPAIPDVTLADIATFTPTGPTLENEPAGLGVVGMPTNFVSSASEQTVPGRLFDTWDVVVHFTPAGFRFDYGDGISATTTTGGASWAALGQAEFTPTATSHVYSARATYPASVTVLYSAWVDFGGGITRSVAGYVESTTGGYDVRVVEVHTALVDKTCVENPAGPGC